jgi:hypothetical protein
MIGMDAKREEVTTYDLASRMIDLDVDLAPEQILVLIFRLLM